jgi:hypothetical protein
MNAGGQVDQSSKLVELQAVWIYFAFIFAVVTPEVVPLSDLADSRQNRGGRC